MAVLVEGLSVIARSNGISKHYEGGDKAFIAEVPTANFCFDGELTRIGFMHPEDVSLYTQLLSERGLNHISKTGSTDFVVVDQLQGLLDQCAWLKFCKIGKQAFSIAVCSLVGGQVTGVAVPDGWEYEGSLSREFGWTRIDGSATQLQFVRRSGHTDVYLDELSGKEMYCVRYGSNMD